MKPNYDTKKKSPLFFNSKELTKASASVDGRSITAECRTEHN